MSKIIIPGNVSVNGNAKKQIAEIEGKHNWDHLVADINKFMRFVSTTPTDLFGARQRGWRIEKLKTSKSENVFSIRITGGDRFTYSVDASGAVTVLGVIGHYNGTRFSMAIPNYDEMDEAMRAFYEGTGSFFDVIRQIDGMAVIPEKKDGQVQTIKIMSQDADYFFNREDYLDTPNNELDEMLSGENEKGPEDINKQL